VNVLRAAVKRRKVTLDDGPDEFEVHGEVAVNDPVPQTDDLLPSTSSCDCRKSVGRWAAASPMTSRFRTTASDDFSSDGKLSSVSPVVCRSILSMASRMSSTRRRAER
jgi:hypothetical protein